jgi:hypothetical protein
MFKDNKDVFKLVDWAIYNGQLPENLSKKDLTLLLLFITYFNSGDFLTAISKKLVKKLINGLIPDGSITSVASQAGGWETTSDFIIEYWEVSEFCPFDNPKELLKFKKRVLNEIINLPEYN